MQGLDHWGLILSDIEKRLQRRAAREKNARKEAERLLEEKSLQLYALNKELSSFAERLELQVKERTRELEVATKAAEQANQSKSKFLANMSHELRTPLNGILGMISLTLNTELNKDQKKYMTLAHSSVHSLLSVINDILDFSKIEAGKVQFEAKDFNIRKLLEEIAQIQSRVAQQKGLELHLDTCGLECALVNGDPLRYRQIIDNLVNNAVKFTEQGEVIIQLSSREHESNNIVTCTVTDTGPGIPKDKHHLLFQSFTQVDGTTTRQHGGTGLGLSIAHRLCQLMDGELSFTSTPGKGTEFDVTLTFPQASEKQNNPSTKVSSTAALVFDLSPISCRVLSRQLRNWGIEVSTVQSFQAFQQYLNSSGAAKERYLFVDGNIGFNELQQLPLPTHSTNILTLPVSVGVDMKQLQRLGFKDCIAKPFIYDELLNCISPSNDQDSEPARDFDTIHSEFANFTVLLVEDEIINQHVAKGLLDLIGVNALLVNSGQMALDTLTQSGSHFDLILMDCQMPNMDGFEATRRIRAGEAGYSNANIPIIALTANVLEADKMMCFEAGMDDHLSKPIVLADLKASLEHWLVDNTDAPSSDNNSLLDIESVINELRSLLDLLQGYDAESGHKLDTIVNSVPDGKLRTALNQIKTLTVKYQYEEAAEALANLLLDLEKST